MSVEPALWIAALLASSGWVVHQGARRADIEERVAIEPKELYARIGKSAVRLQLVDVRPDPGDNYEDTHVPGALPFPNCDLSATPENARERILKTVPTVVISQQGDAASFDRCASFFTVARNLAGGLDAWVDANLPEDSGEYLPPKASAGGGCL